MRGPDLDLKSRISAKILAGGRQTIWTPSDFTDLGPRGAVDKALQRLVVIGDLRRVDRGLYDRPRTNPLTRKLEVPDYRAVIDAIARRDHTRMLVDGMTAANDLGLSDAVPGRVVVHTDARLRALKLGNLSISFRPTSPSKLFWAGRPAMRLVQALNWLKPKLADSSERDRIQKQVAKLLSDPDQGTHLRQDLKVGMSTLPSWMQDFLRALLPPAKAPAKSRRTA
jgi:hypothetical protein